MLYSSTHLHIMGFKVGALTESLGTFDRGPYLQAALFCERVIDEKDNVKSLIRIIDRLQIQATGLEVPETMPPIERDLVAFLTFKSGEARGQVPIRITLTRPSGLTDAEPIWQGTVHFEGGTRGHNLVIRMRTRFTEPGPYWYSVYVGERLATKMPFEIIYTTMRLRGQPPLPLPP